MKTKTKDTTAVFKDLYKEFYPRLTAYASLFLKGEEAHDVVQDVFLSLLETDLYTKQSVNAYLYKAVHNKCMDQLRRQIVAEQYSSDVREKLLRKESEYFYANHNEIEAAFISKEIQEKIEATIESLPPKGKEIFKLFFYEQKTSKEISERLNISKSTVENHLYTCMKTVRLHLTRYTFFLCYLLSQ